MFKIVHATKVGFLSRCRTDLFEFSYGFQEHPTIHHTNFLCGKKLNLTSTEITNVYYTVHVKSAMWSTDGSHLLNHFDSSECIKADVQNSVCHCMHLQRPERHRRTCIYTRNNGKFHICLPFASVQRVPLPGETAVDTGRTR